ncbi:MAG: AMIN domain-containing protein [Acidobacteriota bacterium]
MLIGASWNPVEAQPARDLFSTARARDRQAREALVSPGKTASSTLRLMRAAVAAYEKAVQDPKSGYADTALWLGGELSADAFAVFGEERDRQTALRLLGSLVRDHPHSAYVAKAKDHVGRISGLIAATTRSVSGIRQDLVPGGTTLQVDLDRPVWFHEVRLSDPPRLYFDLYDTRTPAGLRNAVVAFDGGPVTRMRLGHHPNRITRIVIEGAGVDRCSGELRDAPARLVVTCRDAVAASAGAPLPAAAPPAALASTWRPSPEAVGPVPTTLRGAQLLTVVAGWGNAGPPPPGPDVPGVSDNAAPAGERWPPGVGVAPESQSVMLASLATARRALLPSRPRTAAYAELAPALQLPSRLAQPQDRTADRSPLPPVPLLFAEIPGSAPAVRQTTVQVAAAAQVLTGDEARIGTAQHVVPDLGIQFSRPGPGAAQLYADVDVTTRDDRPVVGRGLVRIDGFQAAGLRWTLNAGDTWTTPVAPDFGFANLFAPPINLRGVSVQALNRTTSLLVSSARLTARRNIFGTDTLPMGQHLAQFAVSHRLRPSLDLYARASDVAGTNPVAYTSLVEASTEAGGGLRYRPFSSLQVAVDAGYSAFRRTGSDATERDVSGLIGATWSGSRGWLQLNASRLALGHYAVGNYPYNDRESVFLAGEWSLHNRLRLYGGADYARTGLDPDAAERASVFLPPGTSARAHAGLRLGSGSWSTFGVRVDAGGREIHPSKFGDGFATDTGVVAADWNVRFRGGNVVARYERRSNVDAGPEGSGFTQHDGSGQLYLTFPGGVQLFGQGLYSERADRTGDGQTLWQAGAGGQVPLGGLFVRLEGATGRTRDWLAGRIVRRKSLSAAVSGRLTARTYLSLDVYVDHTPFEAVPGASPWVTRALIRLTRSFTFGSVRLPSAPGITPYRGPTGRITGLVFADWNGNGVADLDEEPVAGVAISAGPAASATAGGDGRFAVDSVPAGAQVVAVDISTVPAIYDPPAEVRRTVSVPPKGVYDVQFGLIPLGSVHGVVYQDMDGNGDLTTADTPVERVVLVLDDGDRTEVTREGRFWFDNVRIGPHRVEVLAPSLPEGTQLIGDAAIEVELTRDEPARQLVYLIRMEMRPEIRKVFPPKKRE